MNLPPELLEHVFTFLDGQSLGKVLQVCRRWNIVAKHVAQYTAIWEHCCKEEIAEGVLEDIVTSLFPAEHQSTHAEIDWSLVYKSWCSWQRINIIPFLQQTITAVYPPKQIISVCVSGNCIITGNVCGEVMVWSLSGELLGAITKHRRRHVISVTPVKFCGAKRTIADSSDGWDVVHDFIVSGCMDNTVHISMLCPPSEATQETIVLNVQPPFLEQVCVCGNVIVVRSENIHFWILELNAETKQLECKPRGKVPCHAFRMSTLCFWQGKVTGFTTEKAVFELDRIIDGQATPKLVRIKGTLGADKLLLTSPIKLAYMWRHHVCLWVTAHMDLCVAVLSDGCAIYQTMAQLHGTVASAHLHGNVLFLGTDTGAVHAYLIHSDSDLLKLDLSNSAWSHSFDDSAVVELNVHESRYGPVVVVVTLYGLYRIAFRPGYLD